MKLIYLGTIYASACIGRSSIVSRVLAGVGVSRIPGLAVELAIDVDPSYIRGAEQMQRGVWFKAILDLTRMKQTMSSYAVLFVAQRIPGHDEGLSRG